MYDDEWVKCFAHTSGIFGGRLVFSASVNWAPSKLLSSVPPAKSLANVEM